tara:strand:- start:123 stop:797 length:675 start_codon:yes stop_codon:yes gene_type:complete
MGFKLRSGNSALAFKNMGSSPAKDGETGGINIDLLKDATVDGTKTKEVDSRPRGQIKKEKRQNKKDEKQYMKYLKKNKMEGDESTFDNWKKSDDNKTSKREARRTKEINMSPEEYEANQKSKKATYKQKMLDLAAQVEPDKSSKWKDRASAESKAKNTETQDLLNELNTQKISDWKDAKNKEVGENELPSDQGEKSAENNGEENFENSTNVNAKNSARNAQHTT